MKSLPEGPYILMLEDDPDDRFITENALDDLGHDVRIIFVKNSTELFSFLQASVHPMLILLDQNCITLSALEVIKRLKSDERYCSIPVMVLGESVPDNINDYYRFGASSFICKPSSTEATKEKIDLFFRYWLAVAELSGALKAV
jgi:CheY-like chemotaxis protein